MQGAWEKGAAGNGMPCIDQLVRITVAHIDQVVNIDLLGRAESQRRR